MNKHLYVLFMSFSCVIMSCPLGDSQSSTATTASNETEVRYGCLTVSAEYLKKCAEQEAQRLKEKSAQSAQPAKPTNSAPQNP